MSVWRSGTCTDVVMNERFRCVVGGGVLMHVLFPLWFFYVKHFNLQVNVRKILKNLLLQCLLFFNIASMFQSVHHNLYSGHWVSAAYRSSDGRKARSHPEQLRAHYLVAEKTTHTCRYGLFKFSLNFFSLSNVTNAGWSFASERQDMLCSSRNGSIQRSRNTKNQNLLYKCEICPTLWPWDLENHQNKGHVDLWRQTNQEQNKRKWNQDSADESATCLRKTQTI